MFLWTRSYVSYIKVRMEPLFKNLPRCIRKLLKFLMLPYFSILGAKYLFKSSGIINKLEIATMDMVVTTKCSLRCRECSNLMQFYKTPYDIPVEKLIKDFDKLMSIIDCLHELVILGGETFCHKQIASFFTHICNNPKVRKITVLTNGTILPNKETLSVLKNPKIMVRVSDYGEISRHKIQLESLCVQYQINYKLQKINEWRACGNLETRNRTPKQLKKTFWKCSSECRSYLNGEFHLCPRSSHGMDLGFIPRAISDYVSIDELDTKNAREQLRRLLFKTRFITACNYCDSSKYINFEKVKPGEQ